MDFDTVIIGGGLSGLCAGIRLLRAGLTCALVSAGQGALHFSSGSFNFCNRLPDGSPVRYPLEILPELARMAPDHPYALLGARAVEELALEAEDLFRSLGMELHGALRAGNHLRMTPLGRMLPAWLSARDACTAPLTDDAAPRLPWRRVVLAQIKGFFDWHPEAASAALRESGTEVTPHELHLPALEEWRRQGGEFRSINIARLLDTPDMLESAAKQLRGPAADSDALLLPACLGLRDDRLADRLGEMIGKPTRIIPTMPPSLIGARIGATLTEAFIRLGGVFMPGDTATDFAADNQRILHIRTRNLENDPLRAKNFLLTSGSFFSKGLVADSESIREPLFGLDLVPAPSARSLWAADRFFADHPFARFGVKTDASLRGFREGKPLANLYVAGMALGHCDALRLGCGAGTALVTALAAAGAVAGTRE
jgi:glycerol-3-phosphate dehydrogenase subunit B